MTKRKIARVSTKWLNLVRKFAQIFFCELLRFFEHETRGFVLFICAKPEIFFAQLAQND